jgi:hypothetical protein
LFNHFNMHSIRPELVEGLRMGFSTACFAYDIHARSRCPRMRPTKSID